LSKVSIHVISETHWDRTWYFPFQGFRWYLVEFMDRLIRLMERDPCYEHFLLDGQTVVLEDCLQIRPEMRGRIEALVSAGRLMVGPLYVLPDEFLEGEEAWIRNYLIGTSDAKSFGRCMKVAYLPDPFGHIAQMPQIARGFGMDCAIFWRGFGEEGDRLGNEFHWAAPDGSKVLVLWQRTSYANLRDLGLPANFADIFDNLKVDQDLAVREIRQETEKLLPHSRTNVIALWNGVDHQYPQPELAKLLDYARRQLPDWTIHHSTPEMLAAEIRRRARRLPAFSGEINRGKFDIILSGVYSARMYLKQRNHYCETQLVRYAEPLSALAKLLGRGTDHAGFLRHAWRTLLKNHPHDDICGCSIDQVHRDMMDRFNEVEQLIDVVTREAATDLANAVDTTDDRGLPFVAFNPTLRRRREVTVARFWVGAGNYRTMKPLRLVDSRGKAVPFVVRSKAKKQKIAPVKFLNGVELEIAFAADVPPVGTQLLFLAPGENDTTGDLTITPRGARNEHFAFRIADDGSVRLKHLDTGKTYTGLNSFEDTEDAGGEYDYSPLRRSETFTTKGKKAGVRLLRKSALEATFRITHRMRVPESLNETRTARSRRRTTLKIVTDVTLFADAHVLRFETTVDNAAKDHRLRACFPAGIRCDVHRVREHFDVLARPNDKPSGKGWVQPPVPTSHQKDFVDLSDGKGGLCLVNEGLPEYEVTGRTRRGLALTLLRGVGWLSRDDLLTRDGCAGPPIETPDAQCLGTHTFRYALAPHGRADEATLAALAAQVLAPVMVAEAKNDRSSVEHGADHEMFDAIPIREMPKEGPISPRQAFLEDSSGKLVLTALKESERGGTFIARFVNVTSKPVRTRIRLGFPAKGAWRTNLAEKREKRLAVRNGAIALTVRPKEIVTVEMRG